MRFAPEPDALTGALHLRQDAVIPAWQISRVKAEPKAVDGTCIARLASVEAFVFRGPVTEPVQTSFGIMRDRPMVLVRVIDSDGIAGWGEVWCNFPSCGAEHRALLVRTILAPLLVGKPSDQPGRLWKELTARIRVLAIQCGEAGPFAQAIAGVDIALWDLHARRSRQPLWRLLGGADPKIRLYASGLNPHEPERLAGARHAEGYRAFKLKIGFGNERDLRNLAAIRETVGSECQLMTDANQVWDLEQAVAATRALATHSPDWLEEPLAADRPLAEWRELAKQAAMPLAAGENLLGEAAFQTAIDSGALKVIQPDVAKWGGISGCLPVAKAVRAAGLRYCPHYLGGGVGLMASAHLLAAVGGNGMLEVDANDNPLRSLVAPSVTPDTHSSMTLPDTPGLGLDVNLAELKSFAVRF